MICGAVGCVSLFHFHFNRRWDDVIKRGRRSSQKMSYSKCNGRNKRGPGPAPARGTFLPCLNSSPSLLYFVLTHDNAQVLHVEDLWAGRDGRCKFGVICLIQFADYGGRPGVECVLLCPVLHRCTFPIPHPLLCCTWVTQD